MKITLVGLDDAEKQMQRIERGTRALGRYEGEVGSRLPYAWGVEYGRHRVSGKLARRAGGAMYLNNAVATVLNGADSDLSVGLRKVTAPGPWVIKRLALWARRLARLNVPRRGGGRNALGQFTSGAAKSHSYRLNKSINYRVTKQ